MKTLCTALLLFFICGVAPAQKLTQAVRGTWITNVDSDVLTSREKIDSATALCAELGINTIFVVTWNKGLTLYPSKTMERIFGIAMDTIYRGRDPLQEMIESAHQHKIKVIAWFEFGFSCSYNLNGGMVLAKKPEWASRNSAGNLVVKNGFEWMNGFHPEVQDFMLALLKEVAANYNVDGIQGDDRLPAMPSEAGYDDYTVALYKKSHNGAAPPQDSKDPDWVQWRADLMTAFMGRIYREIKAIRKNIIVSMSPSIYPWSKEEYLQDWPAWVRKGYVELVIPQVYRYELERYTSALNEIVAGQVRKKDMKRFYPGVLLKVGKYYPSEEMLLGMIAANRKAGITGEVFFFYEGLKKYIKTFKAKLYTDKVVFPKLIK